MLKIKRGNKKSNNGNVCVFFFISLFSACTLRVLCLYSACTIACTIACVACYLCFNYASI